MNNLNKCKNRLQILDLQVERWPTVGWLVGRHRFWVPTRRSSNLKPETSKGAVKFTHSHGKVGCVEINTYFLIYKWIDKRKYWYWYSGTPSGSCQCLCQILPLDDNEQKPVSEWFYMWTLWTPLNTADIFHIIMSWEHRTGPGFTSHQENSKILICAYSCLIALIL